MFVGDVGRCRQFLPASDGRKGLRFAENKVFAGRRTADVKVPVGDNGVEAHRRRDDGEQSSKGANVGATCGGNRFGYYLEHPEGFIP